MKSRIYHTETEEETIALGERLAAELPRQAVVLLIGNLGAGKTTLAKGIVKGLGAAQPEDVSSPTFTLIHEYVPLAGARGSEERNHDRQEVPPPNHDRQGLPPLNHDRQAVPPPNHDRQGVSPPNHDRQGLPPLNHDRQGVPVYHIDLYRLDTPAQVATLGLEEIFDRPAVVLIEWGERFPELMPENHIEIRLRATGESSREIEVEWSQPSPL